MNQRGLVLDPDTWATATKPLRAGADGLQILMYESTSAMRCDGTEEEASSKRG